MCLYSKGAGKLQQLSAMEAVYDSNCKPPQEVQLHIHDKKINLRFLIDSGSMLSVLPKGFASKKIKP